MATNEEVMDLLLNGIEQLLEDSQADMRCLGNVQRLTWIGRGQDHAITPILGSGTDGSNPFDTRTADDCLKRFVAAIDMLSKRRSRQGVPLFPENLKNQVHALAGALMNAQDKLVRQQKEPTNKEVMDLLLNGIEQLLKYNQAGMDGLRSVQRLTWVGRGRDHKITPILGSGTGGSDPFDPRTADDCLKRFVAAIDMLSKRRSRQGVPLFPENLKNQVHALAGALMNAQVKLVHQQRADAVPFAFASDARDDDAPWHDDAPWLDDTASASTSGMFGQASSHPQQADSSAYNDELSEKENKLYQWLLENYRTELDSWVRLTFNDNRPIDNHLKNLIKMRGVEDGAKLTENIIDILSDNRGNSAMYNGLIKILEEKIERWSGLNKHAQVPTQRTSK
jgi:hypothetical protein